jgi:hypothetical protein
MLGGLRIFARMVYFVTKFSLYFRTHGERPIAIGHRRKTARFPAAARARVQQPGRKAVRLKIWPADGGALE